MSNLVNDVEIVDKDFLPIRVSYPVRHIILSKNMIYFNKSAVIYYYSKSDDGLYFMSVEGMRKWRRFWGVEKITQPTPKNFYEIVLAFEMGFWGIDGDKIIEKEVWNYGRKWGKNKRRYGRNE